MKRIVIEGGGDFSHNRGDEAYIASMISMFRDSFKNLEITKFAGHPEEIEQRYGIKAIYSGSNPVRRLKSLWPTFKAIVNADLYVWGGGHIILDSYGIHSIIYRLSRPCFAKLIGKPVIAYAVGAGPLDGRLARFISRICLNKFDIITVRDKFAEDLLRNIGVNNSPIHVTVDPAIALAPATTKRAIQILHDEGVPVGSSPLIAILPWGPSFREKRSLVPMIFRKKNENVLSERRAEYDNHLSVMASACDYMVKKFGAHLVVIPIDISKPGHGGDSKVGKEIISKMKNKNNVTLIEENYSPKEIKAVLGRMELAIGSRMHGLILVSGEGVPLIGINFTQKIRSFAEIIGQEKYFVNVEDVTTVDNLTSLIDSLWKNRAQIKEEIKMRVKELEQKAKLNVKLLAQLLGEPSTLSVNNNLGSLQYMQISKQTKTEIKNIDFVSERDLCTECGTCYGICPMGNIEIKRTDTGKYTFKAINLSKCWGCNICYRACPGYEVDFDQLNISLFSKTAEYDPLGNYKGTYLAHSTDDKIRLNSASGGAVSSLLISALEHGTIDGALVVKMNTNGNPLQPEIFIAHSKEDILKAAGSKYITVPANIGIREILKTKNKKYAIVGLPCHIHGLRKAESFLPLLKKKIVLHIGLFCGRETSPLGTKHLLKKLKVKESEVKEIKYRDGKWPGGFCVKLKSGEERFIPLNDYVYVSKIFSNTRCCLCTDLTAEFADISAGDAWLPELEGQDGWNIIISRTECGSKFLADAKNSGMISILPIDHEKVKFAQQLNLYDKKQGIFARTKIAKFMCGEYTIPRYTGLKNPSKLKFHDYARALILYVLPHVANNKSFGFLIDILTRMPKKILKMESSRKHKIIANGMKTLDSKSDIKKK